MELFECREATAPSSTLGPGATRLNLGNWMLLQSWIWKQMPPTCGRHSVTYATWVLCSRSERGSFLGKTLWSSIHSSRSSCFRCRKWNLCVFRTVNPLWYSLPLRPHIKWWVLQIPDVRWERPRLLRSAGAVPRDGPPSGSLLHQLFPQHLSHWQAVWWEIFSGNVQTGPPGWLQVRNSRHCSLYMMPFNWIYSSLKN